MNKTTPLLLLAFGAMSTSNAFAQAPAGAAPNGPPAQDAAAAETPSEALEQKYAELEAEMRTLQERLAVLSRDYAALAGAVPVQGAPSPVPMTLSALLQSVQNVSDGVGDIEATERTLRELELERAQLRQRFTEQHPEVMLLERRIAATEARLAALRGAETARSDADTARREAEVARREAEAARREAMDIARSARRSAVPSLAPQQIDESFDARLGDTPDDARSAAEQRQAQELDAAVQAAVERFAGLWNTPRYPSNTAWDAMQLVTLTPQLGEYFGTASGVLVLRAPEDESLGLRDGDVILDVGGRVPTSPEHTLRILSSFVPGETLTLGIMRKGQREMHEIALPQEDARSAAAQ